MRTYDLGAYLIVLAAGAALCVGACLDGSTCLRNSDCAATEVCSVGGCVPAPADEPLDGSADASDDVVTPDAPTGADVTTSADAGTHDAADAAADATSALDASDAADDASDASSD